MQFLIEAPVAVVNCVDTVRSTEKRSEIKRECSARTGIALPRARGSEAEKPSKLRGETSPAAETSGMP
jgi:hypothetical protein